MRGRARIVVVNGCIEDVLRLYKMRMLVCGTAIVLVIVVVLCNVRALLLLPSRTPVLLLLLSCAATREISGRKGEVVRKHRTLL